MKVKAYWTSACCSITLSTHLSAVSLSLSPSLLSIEIVQTWFLPNGVSLFERMIQSCFFVLREVSETEHSFFLPCRTVFVLGLLRNIRTLTL